MAASQTITFSMFLPVSTGAVYYEGGLEEAKQLFGRLLFGTQVKIPSKKDMFISKSELYKIKTMVHLCGKV